MKKPKGRFMYKSLSMNREITNKQGKRERQIKERESKKKARERRKKKVKRNREHPGSK